MGSLKTKILKSDEISKAVQFLSAGKVVAFPTETVYGLGANALDPQAVAEIFRAKGRPQDNPLIVHLADQAQVKALASDIPAKTNLLMEKFWPGPLTLVLKKTNIIPQVVTAGLDTVGLRIPDHPVALKLLKQTGFPLAAPSANLSGKPSPTRAEHVFADLAGVIPAILDGGETGWGVESTVLDCTVWPFVLLRPGGVTLEDLRRYVSVDYQEFKGVDNDLTTPRSPGMKYQHYAPQALVYLVTGSNTAGKIIELSESYLQKGQHVGVMTWTENLSFFPKLIPLAMGSSGDLENLARNLYHLLRESDLLKLDVLFIEGVKEDNLGLAIMNRLRKAADNKEIKT